MAGRIVLVVLIIAVGGNGHGRRELLGMNRVLRAKTFWTTSLRKFAARPGRRHVGDIRCARGSLKAAITKVQAPLTALLRALHEETPGHVGKSGWGGVCSAFIATAFAGRCRSRKGANGAGVSRNSAQFAPTLATAQCPLVASGLAGKDLSYPKKSLEVRTS